MSRFGNYKDALNSRSKFNFPRPVVLAPEVIEQLRKEKRFFRSFFICFEIRSFVDDKIIKNKIRDLAMDHHATKEGTTPEQVELLKEQNAIELASLEEKAAFHEAKMMNLLEEYKTLRK